MPSPYDACNTLKPALLLWNWQQTIIIACVSRANASQWGLKPLRLTLLRPQSTSTCIGKQSDTPPGILFVYTVGCWIWISDIGRKGFWAFKEGILRQICFFSSTTSCVFQVAIKIIDKTQLNPTSLQKVSVSLYAAGVFVEEQVCESFKF